MTTFAVVSEKGGTGKTTTAVALAVELARKGKTLLVDLDTSAGTWLAVEGKDPGLVAVFAGRAGIAGPVPLVKPTKIEGLDMVPTPPSFYRVAASPGTEGNLRAALVSLPGYRFAVIDTPPGFGVATVAALTAAAAAVVVMEARAPALDALPRTVETIRAVKASGNTTLEVAGVLVVRMNRTKHAAGVLATMRKRYRAAVFRATIPDTIKVPDAYAKRTPLQKAAPKHRVTLAYAAVAREILGRVKA